MPGAYRIEIEPRVMKELSDIARRDQERVALRILSLAGDPRPAGATKLVGPGMEGWRIRQGDYRIVYRVDDAASVVTITRVGHRRAVYKER